MAKSFDKVWSNCLEVIKDIVEWQHFKTWFEPIKPVELKGNILVIQVPSQFFLRIPRRTLCQPPCKNVEKSFRQGCTIRIQDNGR